ncbi:hypothetical protein JQ615_24835 [Bradyrhizobium jicamae]|uniref:Minor tail protein n=1 Tax=Bradyrhizobium jicamae TaxID=280332 RepID=A0ABS5FP88_9BRAD|nr:hypothetical protein [Bradyrhizobium jicamae]MBR0798617.1 hypothetical protein [Bradyrhizobium jicamae]
MTIRFEKPANATAGYDFTSSGLLWKVTIPKGEWRDVVLTSDGEMIFDLVVLSNTAFVSPPNPAQRPIDSFHVSYGIFGQNGGYTQLDAKRQPSGNYDSNTWPIVTSIQIFVDESGKASDSSGSVKLRYKSQKPTISGGDYDWPTVFELQGANASTNGFIVQKVVFGFTSTDSGIPSENDFWWEGFRVMHGRVFLGASKTVLLEADNAHSRSLGRGTRWHRFEAKFLPGYAEPENWFPIANRSGHLPATRVQPSGWTSIGTTRRAISVTFDSTTAPPTSTLDYLMENY